jgi:N-acetylglucosaminyldiphosphoundecaprenol N-acetyl-beta-D-mannosaminyltransferase
MAISTAFLGIRIDEMAPQEALGAICAQIEAGQKQRIFFVNAHCVNIAFQDASYLRVLKQSEWVLADGSGVLWGAKLLGLPIRHNLNGTDLVPQLCGEAAARGLTVFLLGGLPGVAEQAAARLQHTCPSLRIVGIRHGFFRPEEEPALLAEINAAHPDLLIVAMGVPRQERWITEHWEALDVGAALAVGALFDFLAQRFKRAPRWMRKLGIEWTFRFIQEPRRLAKRYVVGNGVFLGRVLLAALSQNKRRALQQPLLRPAPGARAMATPVEVPEPLLVISQPHLPSIHP